MKQPLPTIAVNAALAFIALSALTPLLWMLSVAFMAPGEASQQPPPLLPAQPTGANFVQLFQRAGMGRAFLNSLGLAVGVTLLSGAINVMAGYAFAKLDFKGRERLFAALLTTLVVPAQVAMMPLFLMLKGMGLVNTYGGVLVPGLASVFGIFLVRQYALGLPSDLLEAARMDGASEWRIFLHIVVPLLRPIIVTLGIFTFLGCWNDFMWPLIVLTDSDRHTLPVALAALSRERVQDNELMMAGAVVTVLPALALFLALQRHYIQGLTVGSVKG